MRIAIIVCIFSWCWFYVNTSAFSLRDELSPFFSVLDDTSQCPHSPHPTCTTKSGAAANVPCVFPFLVNNEKMWTCTRVGGFPDPWCATGVNPSDCSMLFQQWGTCDEETCDGVFEPTTTVPPTSTLGSTTKNTGVPTTEHTETSTTEHIETTIPPTPEDCWYDYLCSTIINIGEGMGEALVNASTCQAACKDHGGCNHFTWYNFHGSPKCWFLETCDKKVICSLPDYCKSGPANCGDLPETCTHLEYTPGVNKIHWVAFDNLNPYQEPIPQGTTCVTSTHCNSWKNPTGPVPEVMATCHGGTNWTLVPPDVTYADGSPFPKPHQGDPDC